MLAKDYIELFSQARINSYTSIDEHEKNFEILGNIAPKLARIEIIVRNRIDRKMRKSDENWLWHLPDDIKLDDDNGNVKDHDTLVSRQTFGFWIKVARLYKIENIVFHKYFLDDFTFKKYYALNNNKAGKKPLRRWQKSCIILQLTKNMRNRAFHLENLLKINKDGTPRLSARIDFDKDIAIKRIEPNKIIDFLDDIINSFVK